MGQWASRNYGLLRLCDSATPDCWAVAAEQHDHRNTTMRRGTAHPKQCQLKKPRTQIENGKVKYIFFRDLLSHSLYVLTYVVP
jgi:hypothetical protein